MRATSAATIGVGAAAAVVVGALVQATGAGSAGTGLGTALSMSVPAEYRPLIEEAGNTCPDVSPNLLAALITQESGFNPKAQSPAGAQGIAQFMPSTWESHGIDGNGDGKRTSGTRRTPSPRPRNTCALLPKKSKTSPATGNPTCSPPTTRAAAG